MRTMPLMACIDSTNFDFTVDGTTIFSASTFHTYCRARYAHMQFDAMTVLDTDNGVTATTKAKAEFKGVFDAWKSCVGANYKRAFEALALTYNPLENYDRIEEGSEIDERHKGNTKTETITEAGTETNSHHKGTKTSTGEETIVTPRVKTKSTTYKVPFDSATEVETDALESVATEGTDKTERDSTKNFTTVQDIDASTFDKDEKSFSADRATTRTTTESDQSATVFDKDIHGFENRRTHGNIGVTSNVQLLTGEWELRSRNFVADVIDAFIRMYCYYFKGIEIDFENAGKSWL